MRPGKCGIIEVERSRVKYKENESVFDKTIFDPSRRRIPAPNRPSGESTPIIERVSVAHRDLCRREFRVAHVTRIPYQLDGVVQRRYTRLVLLGREHVGERRLDSSFIPGHTHTRPPSSLFRTSRAAPLCSIGTRELTGAPIPTSVLHRALYYVWIEDGRIDSRCKESRRNADPRSDRGGALISRSIPSIPEL